MNQTTTVYYSRGVHPAHSGGGMYDTGERGEAMGHPLDHFTDVAYLARADFAKHGIEDISGLIYGENGGDLYAWLDVDDEWRYCLVDTVETEC